MIFRISSLALLATLFLTSCHKENGLSPEELLEYHAGGETTVFDETSSAYEFPSANLDAAGILRHAEGDGAFEATFVTSPAVINPGLGPLFNQNSCVACHGRNGRSAQPVPGQDPGGLLMRLSLSGAGPHGEHLPVPGFGTQLQTKATWGVEPEASLSITYIEEVQQFVDGMEYGLLRPQYDFLNPYTALPPSFEYSPRIAPPVFGLGLLENIPEATILANADPNDANGDGISGKPNYGWDIVTQSVALGRFGWKATEPTLYQQSAKAYLGDVGLTSPYLPVESFAGQPQDDGLADDPELDDETVRLAAFYAQSLAVPAPRNLEDPDVRAGKALFAQAKCSSCHIPKQQTGFNAEWAFLNNQTIYPYTDLLLHDMGPGLADNRPDFEANGQEWRTPPLWGIGLTQRVNGHTNFLHDGRARNLMEAILWHGGEGTASREQVRNMSAKERAQLIKFLEAL